MERELDERTRRFLELRADLLARLELCHVNEDGEIVMYDLTLDAVINFFNFFAEWGIRD